MKNVETPLHVRGESFFIDDLPEPAGVLFAAIAVSPFARGKVRTINVTEAMKIGGVVRVITSVDIPGENLVGNVPGDGPLLAGDTVEYVGQPVAVVVADTADIARKAARLVRVDVEELPPVFDAREAAARGLLIAPLRTMSRGDVDAVWDECSVIVEGTVESGGQEHLYLETQASLAVPREGGRLTLFAGTQSPTGVQRTTARVLGLGMNAVEVNVARLGGAFGGKEDQATPWAVAAALGAHLLRRPVKLTLRRHEDMRWTGKRHPYSSDFRIGLDASGKILAYEVTFYQNSGAFPDLSRAILGRSMFHATNSYAIPNVRVTGLCCRTNLPPFTAFRGFGAPQAMFVMETAIARAAAHMDMNAWEIQRRNLLSEGDEFYYGMKALRCRARRSFEEASRRFNLEKRREEIRAFNERHHIHKKGLSVMPVCFGISFTKTMLNQAGALVHVYTDGTVSVSTGGVEMGQGVNTKVRRIAAMTLGIPEEWAFMESTNTSRVANTSPTAASTGTDLNGMAARMACQAVLERLRKVASLLHKGEPADFSVRDGKIYRGDMNTGTSWHDLVREAYRRQVNLSAQALYATPGLHFDEKAGKGEPFAYHVYGTAITEATVDCLRGTYTIDSVRVVHDAGRSLDPVIDRGQAEGAIVQGLGWMTLEELIYGDDGTLLTDSMTTYKVPDLHAAPGDVEVVFLEDAENPRAVLQSKAIGEPPFMYGIGGYFAVVEALRAFRDDRDPFLPAPITSEKALMFLHGPEAA